MKIYNKENLYHKWYKKSKIKILINKQYNN